MELTGWMLAVLAVEGLVSIGVIVGALWWISEQHGAHDKDIQRALALAEGHQVQMKTLQITLESIRTILQSSVGQSEESDDNSEKIS